VNQDGTVNSAANPAPAGSVVALYGTGAVWPFGMTDGAIASGPSMLNQEQNGFQLIDSVGIPQQILYAGAAPGIINGVFQMNVNVPAGVVVTPGLGWLVRLDSVLQGSVIQLSSNVVGIYVR
jgi:uncharacterized protein (TIGR03437 family)